MNNKQYSKYKDSGVKWLGEIPEHWVIKRVKVVLESHKQGFYTTDPYIDDGVKLIRITDINPDGYVDYSNMPCVSINKMDEIQFKAEKGDFLFARTGSIGHFGFITKSENAVFASYLIRFRFNSKIDRLYLSYSFKTSSFKQGVKSTLHGGVNQNVHAENIKEQCICIPDISEQKKIASFLDNETSRIDSLIAKKEKLLEILEEKRIATISHAVTKGLNPDDKMKDSGIEWIGEIPENWEIMKLRLIINKFVDYRGKTPTKMVSGIPLITARNIKNGVIDFSLSEEFISESDYDDWMIRGIPEIGDVILTTEAPLGEVAQIVDTQIALAQRIILFKSNKKKVNDEYLKHYLLSLSGKGELFSRSTGSTAVGIKASKLKKIMVILPSLNEQKEISKYIDFKCKDIDSLKYKINKAIEKLKEYREALITAAVTGQIDLRDYKGE